MLWAEDKISCLLSLDQKGDAMATEYELIKCSYCGHEKQGRPIIRLTPDDYRAWNTITDRKYGNRTIGALIYLGTVLLACASAILPTLFPLTMMPRWMEIGLGIALAIAIAVGGASLISWGIYRAGKRYEAARDLFWGSRSHILGGENIEHVLVLPAETQQTSSRGLE